MKANIKYVLMFVAAAVVIGGGVFALNQSKSGSTNSTQNTSENTTSEASSDEVAKKFEGPYTITMQATDVEGAAIDGTIKIESKERSQLTFTSQGETVEYILYDGKYYIRAGGSKWIAYSSDAIANQTSEYLNSAQVDDETLAKLKNAPKLGEEACGDETCTVYEITQDGTKAKVFISNSSKLVQKIAGNNPDIGDYEFTFNYAGDFTITPPKNATELNIPNTQEQ